MMSKERLLNDLNKIKWINMEIYYKNTIMKEKEKKKKKTQKAEINRNLNLEINI